MVRRRKRGKTPIIAILIIIGCAIVLVIALVNIFSLQGEYKHTAEVNQKAVEAITEPAKKEDGKEEFKYNHEAALIVNPDAKGMYRNDATETLLPVVQRLNDDDYYLTHFATYTNTQSRDNSDDDELLSAFGAQSEKQPTNSLSNMRIQPQRIEVPRSAAQPQAQNQQQNAPMSLADRIAALRGAISVPNEYKRK